MNHPNPFNPETTIEFYLPESSETRLEIYNIEGQITRTLLAEGLEAGTYTLIWDGRNDLDSPVFSGLYFYRLITENSIFSRKMLLLK